MGAKKERLSSEELGQVVPTGEESRLGREAGPRTTPDELYCSNILQLLSVVFAHFLLVLAIIDHSERGIQGENTPTWRNILAGVDYFDILSCLPTEMRWPGRNDRRWIQQFGGMAGGRPSTRLSPIERGRHCIRRRERDDGLLGEVGYEPVAVAIAAAEPSKLSAVAWAIS